MKYTDACTLLNIRPETFLNYTAGAEKQWKPKDASLPPALWHRKANDFLRESIKTLWSSDGLAARQWLHEQRGLSAQTIERCMLGLNLFDTYRKRESWGLAPSINEVNGKPRKVWLPEGILIPCFFDDVVVRLRIRRFSAPRGGKYIIVSGSDMRSMRFGDKRPVQCIVESELDAILLEQEIKDVSGIIAIGSANARPDRETDEVLLRARVILLALDYDQKEDGPSPAFSYRFWNERYPGKLKRWPCPVGKDPTEAFMAGIDLKAWIETSLD
jgi:hypothetical protein